MDITKGVLAINTEKSVYTKGESAIFQIGSLDPRGNTLCHSNLTLEISGPHFWNKKTILTTDNKAIKTNSTCGDNNVTNEPDYTAKFTPAETGRYYVRLTNRDSKISDVISFDVVSQKSSIQIDRWGATRINPFKSDRYPMVLKVTAEKDFKGQLVERVPANFQIVWQGSAKITPSSRDITLTWDVNMKAGETKEFSYEYTAPKVSPDFIRLGPAKITSSQASFAQQSYLETGWQIASDVACTSNQTGNWGDAGIWDCTHVPANGDSAIIAATHNVTLNTSTNNMISVTINGTLNAGTGAGYAITLNGTTGTLFTNNGVFTSTNSTITITSNAAVTLFGGTTAYTGSTGQINNLSFTGVLSASRVYTQHATAGTAVTYAGSISDTHTGTAGGTRLVTFNMNGATIVGGTITMNAGVNASSTFDTTATNYALTVGAVDERLGTINIRSSTFTLTNTSGTLLTLNGTFTAAAASTTIINGDGDLTISGGTTAPTFGILKIAPTITDNRTYSGGTAFTAAGALTLNTTAASALTLTINLGGNLTNTASTLTYVESGAGPGRTTLNTTASNYNIATRNITITANSALIANNSTITLNNTSGTLFTNSGTFTANSDSTVQITSNASVTLFAGNFTGSNSLGNLAFTGALNAARVYTAGVAFNLTGNLIDTHTGVTSARNLRFQLSDDSSVNGTIALQPGSLGTSTLNTTASAFALSAAAIDLEGGGIAANATLLANGSVITLNGTGTLLTNNGTFTQATSNVTITSPSGTPTLLAGASTTSFNILNINTDSTILNTGAELTISNANAGNGLFITKGVLNDSGLAITGSNNGTLNITANGTLCLGGPTTATSNVCNAGGATSTTARAMPTFNTYQFNAASTVRYLSDADMATINRATAYGNLILSPILTADRAYTFDAGAVTVNGNFTINPNTDTAHVLTVTMGGDITLPAANTINITATSNATSSLVTYVNPTSYNLSSGKIYIGAGGTLNATTSTSTITVNGTSDAGPLFTRAGSFLAGSSTVIFNGNNTNTPTLFSGAFTAGNSLYNVTISPTITVDLTYMVLGSSALTVSNNFTVNPSAAVSLSLAVLQGNNLTVTGTTTIQGSGAGPALGFLSTYQSAPTCYNLTTGNVNIAANGILYSLDCNSIFTINGNFTNNGTFVEGTSTVVLATTSEATLTGNTTFYNFSSTVAGKTIKFTSGQTFRINGLFTITGTSGSHVTIRSTTLSSQWYVYYKGTQNITYSSIYDSGCDALSDPINVNATNDDGAHDNNGTCWGATALPTYTPTPSPTITPTPTVAPSPTPGANLIPPTANWNFDEGYGTTIHDASGNSHHLNHASTFPTWQTEDMCVMDKCLKFNGSTDGLASDTVNGVKSVAFWVKPMANSAYLLALTSTVTITTNSTGVVSANNFTSPTIYINGIAQTTPTLPLYQWSHVEVTTGTGVDSNAIMIGETAGGFANAYFDEVKFFTTAHTAAQVRTLAIRGASPNGSAAVLGMQDTSFLNQGLIGYWKMDGDATDASGIGQTLTNYGTTPYAGSKFSLAAGVFNGSSRYFGYGSAISGIQTVSMWVYPTNTSNYYFHLTNSTTYVTSTSGTVTATGFTNPVVYVNGVINGTITANTWQLLTVSSTAAISAANFEIGRANGSYLTNNSYVDDVRIYNRVLSPREVANLYEWAPTPLLYYKFDENVGTTTVVDSSTHGYTGDMGGATYLADHKPHWTTGKYGSALKFDGEAAGYDQYLTVQNSDAFLDGERAFTMSAWVKYDTLTDWGLIAMKQSDSTHYIGFGLGGPGEGDNDDFEVCVANGSNSCAYTTGNIITTGTWYYLTVVYEGSQTTKAKLYVNGVLQTVTLSAAFPTSAATINQPLEVGSFAAISTLGILDDVKIYNYARSSKQIVEDMNAGHPAGGSPIGSQVGFWKFDEGSGDTARNYGYAGSVIDGNLGAAACPGDASCPNWASSGKFGMGLSFKGAQAVFVPTNTNLNFGNGTTDRPFSVGAWINPANSNPFAIFSYAGELASDGPEWIFYANGNGSTLTLQLYDNSTANWIAVNSVPTIPTNTWTHVLATYNGGGSSGIKLYINGIQVATTAISQGTYVAMHNLGQNGYIGALWPNDGAYGSFATGQIDELKIYSDELSGEEVKIDYDRNSTAVLGSLSDTSQLTGGSIASNSANAAYCIPGDSSPCASPVGEWNYDDNAGSTVKDTSGHDHNGTWQGTLGNQWTAGKYGSAGRFNGTNNYVSAINTDGSLSIETTITLEAWINSNNAGPIYSGHADGGYKNYFFAVDSYMYFLYETGGGTPHYYTSTNTYDWSDGWHFIALTFTYGTGTSMQMYRDGQPVAGAWTTGNGNAAPFTGNTVFLGYDGPAWGDMSSGVIDQTRVFNYIRTPAQILWDYNRGAAMNRYKFDECTGNVTHNSAINSLGQASGIDINIVPGAGRTTGSCGSGTATEMWNGGTNGRFNGSLAFDGSGDSANSSSTINLTGTTKMTVSFWLNWDSYSNNDDLAMESSSDFNANNGAILIDPNSSSGSCNGYAEVAFRQTNYRSECITRPSAGVWHFWTAVFDTSTNAGDIKIYIDGIEQTTIVNQTGTGAAPSFGNFTWYFMSRAGSSLFGAGKMDETQIFPYALTAAQIKLLYNQNAAVRVGP